MGVYFTNYEKDSNYIRHFALLSRGFEHLYPERGIPGTLAETKTRWCTGINGSQRLFRSPREEIVLSRERFIIGKNQGGGYFHKLPK